MDNNLLSLTFTGNAGRALILTLVAQSGKLVLSTASNYETPKRIGVCQGGTILEALEQWEQRVGQLSDVEAKGIFGALGEPIAAITGTTFNAGERIPTLREQTVLAGVGDWKRYVGKFTDKQLHEFAGPLLSEMEGKTKTGKP